MSDLTPSIDDVRAQVISLHRPVEIEPSSTICGECSWQLPNGSYFGKVIEYPCPTLDAFGQQADPGIVIVGGHINEATGTPTAEDLAAFDQNTYENQRKAYWTAQENFRGTAMARIRLLIPDTHAGVLLEINDTPRLSLYAPVFEHGVIDQDADVYDQGDTVWGDIDGIANDMEAGTWDEAESFLETMDTRFVIWKDPDR